ncbi:MAG TPA: hypothetical protein VMB47_07010 [Candidatus Aquilonibacter sp.]|nr:hypothetical protein [Candidatus Aquilonibacter sp.]
MRVLGQLQITLAAFISVGFVSALPGQSTSPAPLSTSSATLLAVGTTICAVLANSIDAKKAKPGDAITTRVTLPVLSHGKVIIPNGAKITGHLTLVQTRSRDSKESEIGIVFDHAVLKGGVKLPLSLTVQAIGGAPQAAAGTASQDLYNPNLVTVPGIPGAPGSSPRQFGLPQGPPLDDQTQPSRPNAGPESAQSLILDAASHGVIGLPDLTLTESSDAASGSIVKSLKKNVKLYGGTQIILRVIGP